LAVGQSLRGYGIELNLQVRWSDAVGFEEDLELRIKAVPVALKERFGAGEWIEGANGVGEVLAPRGVLTTEGLDFADGGGRGLANRAGLGRAGPSEKHDTEMNERLGFHFILLADGCGFRKLVNASCCVSPVTMGGRRVPDGVTVGVALPYLPESENSSSAFSVY